MVKYVVSYLFYIIPTAVIAMFLAFKDFFNALSFQASWQQANNLWPWEIRKKAELYAAEAKAYETAVNEAIKKFAAKLPKE